MKISIRTRLIFSVIFIIFIFGSLATFFIFKLAQKDLINLEKNNLKKLNIESTHEIDYFFSSSKNLAATIARQGKVIDCFFSPENQEAEILGLLEQYNINKDYSAIYLIDPAGNTLISTDPSFTGKNYSFRDYFKEAISGKAGISMAIGVTNKQPGYYFSAPVKKEDKIIGVVVLKQKPGSLNRLLADDSVILKSHTMFTDNYGVIVYSDIERIYKSLGNISREKMDKIKKENKFPEVEILPLQYETVQRAVESYRDPQILQFFDQADGEEEILSISQVGESPFFLIYETEAEKIIAPAYKIGLTLGFFVMGAAFIAALIISLLVSKFLKPLTEFKTSVKEISAGNLNKKINIGANDELSELALDFNKMIDRVKESRENIEKKVLTRTAELNKFNQLMVGRELKMIELKKRLKELETGVAKKRQNKTWSDKFREAVEVEEGVINQLKSVYLMEIEKSEISVQKKKKMKKLLNELVEDSIRHDQEFKKLIVKADEK